LESLSDLKEIRPCTRDQEPSRWFSVSHVIQMCYMRHSLEKPNDGIDFSIHRSIWTFGSDVFHDSLYHVAAWCCSCRSLQVRSQVFVSGPTWRQPSGQSVLIWNRIFLIRPSRIYVAPSALRSNHHYLFVCACSEHVEHTRISATSASGSYAINLVKGPILVWELYSRCQFSPLRATVLSQREWIRFQRSSTNSGFSW